MFKYRTNKGTMFTDEEDCSSYSILYTPDGTIEYLSESKKDFDRYLRSIQAVKLKRVPFEAFQVSSSLLRQLTQ